MNKKIALAIATLFAFLVSSIAAWADPVETYLGIKARNPAGVVAAMDNFFATNAAKGSKVYLVRAVFDGDDPATHVLVSDFDSYTGYEEMVGKRMRSEAWGDAMAAVMASSEVLRNGFGVIRANYGEGWPERDNFVMVFSVQVQDAQAYAKAFGKLAKSEVGQQAPGITRLMENRSAGAAPSHFVIMSAPSFSALNNHLDAMFASNAYEDFNDDVKKIRTVVGTATYRKVKAWTK